MRIVLASGSAARQSLLSAAGVVFEAAVSGVDEAAVKARGGGALKMAGTLAEMKALAVSRALPPSPSWGSTTAKPSGWGSADHLNRLAVVHTRPPRPSDDPLHEREGGRESLLVIGSDQTLELDGETLDKVTSIVDLRAKLTRLRGRAHRLHSAVAVAWGGEIVWTHTDTARLVMRDFSDVFLDAYVDRHGEAVRSSLGGYWFEAEGAQLFDQVEGDYFTILGMPLLGLLRFLREAGAMAT